MKKFMYITMAMMSLFLISCSDDETENGLIGTWASSSTNEGVEMDITLVLATSTFTISTEMTYYGITTSCSGSGDWSSNDTSISFSGGTMSCDTLDEDINMEPATNNYVLSENTLTITSVDGDETVYTRQ